MFKLNKKNTDKIYIMDQNIDSNPDLILGVIKNLQNALEIANKAGAYTLQQASATYENLKMLNKYVEATRGFLSKSEPQAGFMNLRPGSGGVMNIPKMTLEEAADSDAQERAKRAMLLNRENDEGEPINLTEEQKEQLKKERAELKKIEEMESLIAKAVETSDEEEEPEPEPEVYEVVESEEEEVDEVVEQKEINPIFSKEIRTKKKLETEKQIFNDYYSDDSDDLETIAI